MCGTTAAEHTCRCCSPEGRKARAARARQARRESAQAEGRELGSYARHDRDRAPRAGVVVEGGWVRCLPRDLEQAHAAAVLESIGPEHRDGEGRILWLQVPAHLRAAREFETPAGGVRPPARPPITLPPGIVDDHGQLDEAAAREFWPEPMVAHLRDQVRVAFDDADDENEDAERSAA